MISGLSPQIRPSGKSFQPENLKRVLFACLFQPIQSLTGFVHGIVRSGNGSSWDEFPFGIAGQEIFESISTKRIDAAGLKDSKTLGDSFRAESTKVNLVDLRRHVFRTLVI